MIARIRSATATERNEVGAGEKTPAKVLEFEPMEFFVNAVLIRPLLDQLEMFERVRQRWGIALVGGSRRISKHDFDLVLKAAKTAANGVGGQSRKAAKRAPSSASADDRSARPNGINALWTITSPMRPRRARLQ